MGIDAVELRRLTLPMVTPFRSGAVDLSERDLLLVRAVVDGVDGWGECAALPSSGYTELDVEGATRYLQVHAPRLMEAQVGRNVAVAPLRDALLDARLRAIGESLASHLGVQARSVSAGVAVGFEDSIAALLDEIARQVDQGYDRVKLKIGPGRDIDVVAAVRARFGESLALQVDANGAYTLDDTPTLVALDDFDLLLIEQPLASGDLEGHAELTTLLSTPVCLDESIRSLDDLERALAIGACDVVCIKPSLMGGIAEARIALDRCEAAGVDAWLGGMLETGIGRAGLLALAGLPGFTMTGDLSATGRWYVDDLVPPLELVDGALPVPSGPGIGVVPDPAALARYTRWSEVITAP